MGFCKWFDEQTTALKVILLIPFWGWFFSFLYRLDRFLEHRDVASLIGWILALVFNFFMSILDLISVALYGKIKFLVYGGENFGINGTVDDTSSNEVKPDFEEVKEEKKDEE